MKNKMLLSLFCIALLSPAAGAQDSLVAVWATLPHKPLSLLSANSSQGQNAVFWSGSYAGGTAHAPHLSRVNFLDDQNESETIVNNVSNGVVTIRISATLRGPKSILSPDMSEIFKKLLGGENSKTPAPMIDANPKSVGSGFFIDPSEVANADGRPLIVTNAHVVSALVPGGKPFIDDVLGVEKPNLGAEEAAQVKLVSAEMTVEDNCGIKYPAELVGYSDTRRGYDLALVRLKTGFKPEDPCAGAFLPMAPEGHNVRIGDYAQAVGSPHGMQDSHTFGSVSYAARPTPPETGILTDHYIQTQTPINQGNSGGPLIGIMASRDGNGLRIPHQDYSAIVIGVNELTMGEAQNMSLSIPIYYVRHFLARYNNFARSNNSGMFTTADPGLIVKASDNGSLQIAALADVSKSPDHLQIGDTIISVDGKSYSDPFKLMQDLADQMPGDQATFTIKRGASQQQITVQLQPSGS